MESIKKILKRENKSFKDIKRKVKGHFTMVPNSFIMSEDFTSYEKLIWIILNKYKMTHQTCWPSHKTVSKNSGCSISTVKKALKGLEIKGKIKKEKKKNYKSNVYTVL